MHSPPSQGVSSGLQSKSKEQKQNIKPDSNTSQ